MISAISEIAQHAAACNRSRGELDRVLGHGGGADALRAKYAGLMERLWEERHADALADDDEDAPEGEEQEVSEWPDVR